MARRRKIDTEKADGTISAKEIERIRNAIRQVWMWTSVARKNVIKRCTDKNGFARCENKETCKHKGKRVPKIYVDHIQVLGSPLHPTYIERTWCRSDKLQGLCKSCHDKKTKQERDAKPKPLFTDMY